jgi:two-component system, OmpR family, sensor kinase
MRAANGSAIVAIRDHGPGVPEDYLSKIFEAFYRVADSRDRETGGRRPRPGDHRTDHGIARRQRKSTKRGGRIVELRFPERNWLPWSARAIRLVTANQLVSTLSE